MITTLQPQMRKGCSLLLQLVLLLLFSLLEARVKFSRKKIDTRSPLYQSLPDCRNESAFIRIQRKQTQSRSLVCTSFHNEEGFLSEFIAYYYLHGIDHIRLFDLGSVDHTLVEAAPWIKSGFVSVEELQTLKQRDKSTCQSKCKNWAHNNNFDYHFTIDIDEYMVPVEENVALMDVLDLYFKKGNNAALKFPRYNIHPIPHTIEPIHLLTIEAYQVRSIAPNFGKVGLYLNHRTFRSPQNSNLIHCCDASGCNEDKESCRFIKVLDFDDASAPVVVFHYLRSLEKYELKYSVYARKSLLLAKRQDVGQYLENMIGGTADEQRAALRYGCQVRDILRNFTAEKVYIRPGPYWYHNVKYGKELLDGRKGKRNGKPLKAGNRIYIDDPHEYHGFYKAEIKS